MSIGTLHHSGHVLHLARAAHQRSLTSRSEAEVCITLCAAAFEGFLNETAHTFAKFESPESAVALAEILAEAESSRLSAIAKFRMAAFALSGRFPRQGDRVVQRLSALVKLRNAQMHLKPEPVFTLDESHAFYSGPVKPPAEIALLVAEGVIAIPEGFTGTWRQLLSSPAVAQWAYEVTVGAMQWLTSLAVDQPVRQRLSLQTDGIPGIENAG